ncbi:MAG TPA: hypothetical protein VLF90_03645 [Patescibacteria group bacterium]|nr:hypothetical protein [Patescibacteria group bacterium]
MSLSKRLHVLFIRVSSPLVWGLAALAGIGFILFYRLGSLVPGWSQAELSFLNQSRTFKGILNNPLNAPYKLAQLALILLHHEGPIAMRSLSALIGLTSIALFYYVIRKWHTTRVALMSVVLLATSSWFLGYARVALPAILYTFLIAALAYGTWLRSTKKSALALFVGAALAVFLIYIPGLVWFVLVAGVWQRKAIFAHYKDRSVLGFLAIIMGCVLLLPLIYGLVMHPQLTRSFAGLPLLHWPSVLTVCKNILYVPYHLAVHSGLNPVFGLSNLPLLDIFTLAMAVLGIYAYFFRRQLDRTKLLLGSIILGVALISLGGGVEIVILLPFIYLFAAGGITLMLQQWFTVFPLNPLARIVATTLMTVIVLMASFYHINRYFVAWPNAPITKQTFHIHS